jgi:hypothetical protein
LRRRERTAVGVTFAPKKTINNSIWKNDVRLERPERLKSQLTQLSKLYRPTERRCQLSNLIRLLSLLLYY